MEKKKKKKAATKKLQVTTLKHEKASRKNIPTAEHQSVMTWQDQNPIQVAYERRNRDLDPQLVWRGKDDKNWSDLVVQAPPLFIQEKAHPKALIDDLVHLSEEAAAKQVGFQTQMFADFNGFPSEAVRTDFYKYDGNWTNRMILGDSLQVMASLAEREGLRGQVQCIYFDPPYGIKFNSNFQWSTTSRDVKDGKAEHITREPEQVKAFRDTWRDGIHSYLSYLRDRLTVARDLLAESGSIFIQIGDENAHRVRALMDEVFGEPNLISQICLQKTGGQETNYLPNVSDYIIWYAKDISRVKYRQLYQKKELGVGEGSGKRYDRIELEGGERRSLNSGEKTGKEEIANGARVYQLTSLISSGVRTNTTGEWTFQEKRYHSGATSHWKTSLQGLDTLAKANRIQSRKSTVAYVRFLDDFRAYPFSNIWTDVAGAAGKVYIVQTSTTIVQRCLLMASDPGDLILDPTCGSGTTAYVAEQWGRRWITIDTSRVALALARARIMGARYPYYLLADSPDGQRKEAELRGTPPSTTQTYGDIRQGFVYERIPHITLNSIANNSEIEIIWERFRAMLEPLREQLNAALKKKWQEWEIPREADSQWSTKARKLHAEWWELRTARQREIDASIAEKTDYEYLYDKPYEDPKTVRVAGPFTVESVSPHRVLGVDANGDPIDSAAPSRASRADRQDFATMVLENLKTAGVHQKDKGDRIVFSALTPWPGDLVCAEGRYVEGDEEGGPLRRAAIFIGPEFGTVSRADLVAAAREAGDADFDVLIACAFNYEAHASEFKKLGRIPVLKARMNAELHMADDLKNTGKGNLFVIFGEPDIDIFDAGKGQIQVKVNGVDVFHPSTGEIRSDSTEGIACWFIDTNYNEESFCVRHAYFLGANDPYKALKTTLKAEINEDAWQSLHSDISRPFDKPETGRIAVKVINHLGDEVMRVFRVS
jgi:adenine-specific DNA-methyltransferase